MDTKVPEAMHARFKQLINAVEPVLDGLNMFELMSLLASLVTVSASRFPLHNEFILAIIEVLQKVSMPLITETKVKWSGEDENE